jgi:hypothetical protein
MFLPDENIEKGGGAKIGSERMMPKYKYADQHLNMFYKEKNK